MRKCRKCGVELEESEFYIRSDTGGLRSNCKSCCKRDVSNNEAVANWRRNVKIQLVKEAGGKCVDCGHVGPAYHFDFDHRNPSEKEFQISRYSRGIEKLKKEIEKCDLVCALCHRDRTHRQRCNGCDICPG